MRMHPQLGVDIISNIKFPYPVADSILAHHERYDGQGYPKGLRGHDIPLGARVLAVADAFDGYISEQPEGKESLERAIRWVHEGSAAAFDPEIVTVLGKDLSGRCGLVFQSRDCLIHRYPAGEVGAADARTVVGVH